ncbi:lanthionine synthetase C family protein [Staphylococcus felis]|uniref:lanthionine synthetase C family protein n=1 Tax=Staphylococcus felis TaxID=46127 RepID=UPI001EE8A889|nr:lanthionine synthetase C family protein [Staphylococcus felis]
MKRQKNIGKDMINIKLIKDILDEEIEFLSNVENASYIIENRSEFWDSYTLSHGYPGVILFLDSYQKSMKTNLSPLIHQYVSKLGDYLEQGIEGYSLFSGLTGVAFSIDLASNNNQNYQKILKTLDAIIIDKVNQFFIKSSIEANPSNFDVIQGLTGVGRYLLNRVNTNPEVNFTLKSILSYITDIHYSKKGWIISNKNQFLDIDKKRFPSGNINLGLAHGILGPFSLMALCKIHNFEIDNHKTILEDFSKYILNDSFQNKNEWLDRYDIEERYYPNYTVRNGWCYGETGLMNTLLLLGISLNDDNLIQKSKDILIKISKSDNTDLISPTFCHGLSSHLTILNEANKTLCAPQVEKYIEKVKHKIIEFYSIHHEFMFQDIEIEKNQKVYLNKVGILEGQLGVLLALMDYTFTKKNLDPLKGWKNIFLIN